MFNQTFKKILVCGGAGFIGSNFVRHLYTAYPDCQVFNLDLLTYSGNKKNLSDLEGSGRYEFIHGDICDKNLLNSLFSAHHFDVVVNFAAESHVDRSLHSSYHFIQSNVVGTHTLIEAARQHKIPRFIQISTDEVYGDVGKGESDESAPLNPSSPYSSSKASADLLIKSYVKSHGLPAVIIRGSNNFGPYQYPEKLIPLAISNLLEGKKIPVHGNGLHIRSWLYVQDFCNAIDAVMCRGKLGEIYNASGVQKTNLEVLEEIAKNLNMAASWQAYKIHTNDRPGADLRYAPDCGKITRELGWQPLCRFEDGMKNTVQWYLDNRDWWTRIKNTPAFLEHYEKQSKAQYF